MLLSPLVSVSPLGLQGKRSSVHPATAEHLPSGKHTWPRQKCNRPKSFLQATLKNTPLQAGGFKTPMRACEAQEGRRLRLRGLNKEHSLGHFY